MVRWGANVQSEKHKISNSFFPPYLNLSKAQNKIWDGRDGIKESTGRAHFINFVEGRRKEKTQKLWISEIPE